MKVFRCEMCGSSEPLKTEDLYACKNCGTKYTLENAKKLLIETDLLVSEISDNVGFLSQFAFATAYKKHFGITPQEFKLSENEDS